MTPGFRRIAHRGASRLALENTLPAFRAGLAAGAQWFEFDVWLSADRVPFVFHDAILSRMAGRPEAPVRMGMEQIRQVRLAGGGTIASLEDVVSLLGEAGAFAYVEIKDANPAIVPAIAGIGLPGGWVVSSFRHDQLRRARECIPGVLTQALFRGSRMPRLPPRVHIDEIGIPDRSATPQRITGLLERYARPVMVYTVNDPRREAELAAWGAAGVYTDAW